MRVAFPREVGSIALHEQHSSVAIDSLAASSIDSHPNIAEGNGLPTHPEVVSTFFCVYP